MKKSLLLYLFILAVLMNIFTYMYFSKKTTFDDTKYVTANKKLKDSLDVLSNKLSDANYFDFNYNQNAQDYVVNNELDKIVPYEKIVPFVTQKLMDLNEDPNGNPYTGQTKISDKKFIINKAKILNHRWIIADYSDGTYWGEVLLKYFINPDKTVSFEVVQSLIYQK
ncbi:MAG: hypothetical protein EOO48_08720 [Flavobacterium sp.]|nr:MAG: hypothetical protein EOO48_08720 [Flavobacterium sp.]